MRPSGVGPPWSLQPMDSADVAPSGIGSSSSGAGAAPCDQAIEEEEDPGQPGKSSTTTTLDEEPSTSLSPPPAKKNRASRGALIEFLKEEAKREQEHFEATQANTKKFFNWVHTWSREQPCQSVSLAMSASIPPHLTWWNHTNVPNILCRVKHFPRCEADIMQHCTGGDD
ncbi:hypothetical protein NQZ68_009381 [Dissostichus eleginoides]|nr:hypothetical protein NQZ68_009381 [Dissostichus eleginoides]